VSNLTDETVSKLNDLLKELAAEHRRSRRGRENQQGAAPDSPSPAHRGQSGDLFAGMTTAEAQREIEKLDKRLIELRKSADKTQKSYSSLTESIDKAFKTEEIQQATKHATEYKKILQELKNDLAAAGDDTTRLADAQRKADNALDDLSDATKEASAALGAEEGLSKELAQVGQSMFGLNLTTGGTTEKLLNLGKKMGDVGAESGSMIKAFGSAGKAMGLAFATKIVDTFMESTKQLMKEQDKAISSFRRATGAGKEYNLEMAAMERRNFAAGISAEAVSKAYNVLYTSFSQFTQLNQTERETLSETTTLLETQGVQMATSAKIMDQLSRNLGQGPTSMNETMLRLAGNAQSLGVSMDQMASDFAGAITELSKYGDQAIEVFEDLSKQAKATGLAVGDLMGIAQQFDQFDTAAKSVGRLNAIMGGPYLNSIDMLNASEAERIELLRQSVDAAGIQFDSLGRFEQQAMAAALGMKVGDARRLMKMSTDEMKLQALQQEELAELARNSQEIMDQIKNAMKALAVDFRPLIENLIVPLIEAMGTFAQWLGKAETGLGRFIKMGLIAGGIAALIAAPFTGGATLAMYAALSALVGGGIAAATVGADTDTQEMAATRYAGFSEGTGVNQTVGDRFGSTPRMRRINVSEIGSEKLTVPDQTIVQTHQDLRLEVQGRKEMQKSLNEQTKFLKEMAAGNQGDTYIKIDDGNNFSTTVTRQGSNALFSPFGGRGR